MTAYLADLSATPTSPSFELCKRLLNKCQAIVFADGQSTDTDIVDAATSVSLGMSAHKVRENAIPALVGMGALIAGIGQPLMTRQAGRIAIAQGRRNRVLSIASSNAPNLARRNTFGGEPLAAGLPPLYGSSPPSKESTMSTPASLETVPSNQRSLDTPYQSASQPDLPISKRRSSHFNPFTSSPSLEDLHRGKAFSVSRYIKSAHQKLNRKIRPAALQSPTKSLSVFDPKLTALGQSSVPTNSAPLSPALSQCSASSEEVFTHKPHARHSFVPRISTSFDSSEPASRSDLEDSDSECSSDEDYSALSQLSLDHRKSLLRSNYFRSEMQFLLALVDIATRLVIVPKTARMSALHAELTLLNHNLPAEICIPLWCPATAEKPHHHRVVRISPSDAVVLNSAERAPYLLMIEVLDDELSFEDDYSSALCRRRRTMKHKKSRAKITRRESGRNSLASPSTVISPHSEMPSQMIDMGECSPASAEPIVLPPNETSIGSVPGISDVESNGSDGRRNSRSADEYAERMRTAAIMLAQLQQNVESTSSAGLSASSKARQGTEQIRQRIIKEMIALEDQRMARMKKEGVSSGVGGGGGEGAGGEMLEDEQRVASVINKDDPSAAVFSEDWDTKKARIRASSPYGHLPNWRLLSVIVKTGADLRQEQFAIQLIREMQRIWQDTGVDVWVKYFRVLVTSDNSGLIETLRNTISVHSIKKTAYARGWNAKGVVFTLRDYFERNWGKPESDEFIKAQDAFMRSLAGYSIACYILQIKDRHNGNLLIDNSGHLIHIDFGFMLSNSPGSVGFEMAPFKLPQEYIDILGGVHGEKFAEYKALMKAAFIAVRKHSENILLLVEMMCKDSKLPCFQNGEMTVQQLRDRFQLQLTEPQVEEFVDKLIMSSCCNVFTRLYDTFQYYSQGIL
ncbi:Phosphatidylinositol 4-kinase pik1alpha (PI4-kinase)(PtdIns-4-kinase) [Apophysomyces ossiformis]|uniref:1-phosphatidylinositol 4-kinase n=1 Tax=Apophysomyces ossiformis TaxID=679940 RepID=A0A8H7BJH9_9FUNG|nr:Phosphatidylinositol 4-kinase pik1alpha (PI4-kinase)(PtdIns-4-kinase) [Apophysomyces ossiformis]